MWTRSFEMQVKFKLSFFSFVFLGCPQVIVNGASAVLTATTSNVPQTLTCSNGTFPGGFTTQQFVCNTATSQWTPNPITTTCGTGTSIAYMLRNLFDKIFIVKLND